MTSVVGLLADGVYKRMMIVSLSQLGLVSQPDTIGFPTGCGVVCVSLIGCRILELWDSYGV